MSANNSRFTSRSNPEFDFFKDHWEHCKDGLISRFTLYPPDSCTFEYGVKAIDPAKYKHPQITEDYSHKLRHVHMVAPTITVTVPEDQGFSQSQIHKQIVVAGSWLRPYSEYYRIEIFDRLREKLLVVLPTNAMLPIGQRSGRFVHWQWGNRKQPNKYLNWQDRGLPFFDRDHEEFGLAVEPIDEESEN
ncbi:hypothetical protein F5Y13DRAFT_194312 [Hypoxylon sp. FL1857]|nr:hypothetical protein F5Y13DRAFT_194312 [Hypoxylon sp. FL1857]